MPRHIPSPRLLTGWLAGTLLLLTSCDSGSIADRDVTVQHTGRVVQLTATVDHPSDWQGSYSVALAAFANGSQYAITQRILPEGTATGTPLSITIDNVPAQASTIELALTNKLRKRILTLASLSVDDTDTVADTIRMSLGTLSLDQTNCIRRGVFNVSCIQCHGANGHAAAGLDLTCQLPAASKMRQILDDGGASTLRYNHTDVLSSHFRNNLEEVKTLLYEWIKHLE